MTINDQKSITMYQSYKLMTDSIKALMDNLKRSIPDLGGLELEQVSARLYRLSVLWNGLQGILGYDSPNEAFADVVDYEIVDQLKWLERLRNQIRSSADINDDELLELASEVDEAVRYIAALGTIRDDIVEMFVGKLYRDSVTTT